MPARAGPAARTPAGPGSCPHGSVPTAWPWLSPPRPCPCGTVPIACTLASPGSCPHGSVPVTLCPQPCPHGPVPTAHTPACPGSHPHSSVPMALPPRSLHPCCPWLSPPWPCPYGVSTAASPGCLVTSKALPEGGCLTKRSLSDLVTPVPPLALNPGEMEAELASRLQRRQENLRLPVSVCRHPLGASLNFQRLLSLSLDANFFF